MKLKDEKTIFLFEELAKDGASLDNLGSLNAYEKYVKCSQEVPDNENYDKQDLLKADVEVKKTALKIINEKELNFAKLIIENAEAQLKSGESWSGSTGLIYLAWKIIKENADNASIQLTGQEALNSLEMSTHTPREVLPSVVVCER